MARPGSYWPAEDRLIVEACRPRAERLQLLAAELGRSPEGPSQSGRAPDCVRGPGHHPPPEPLERHLRRGRGRVLTLTAAEVARLADDDAILRAALDAALTARNGR